MITATAQPLTVPPSIAVELTGVTPGGILLRDGTPVRGGAITAASQTVIDYDAPLGRTVVYTYGPDSAPAIVSSATAWLCHPSSPSLSRPVTIVNDDPFTLSARGTVHRPLSGGAPFAVYGPRSGRSGDLQLTLLWADRSALTALARGGTPLLVRTPPACLIDDQWIWCGDVTHTRAADSERVYLSLAYETVAAPVTLPPAGERPISWADVVNLAASWNDVPTLAPSWADLVAVTVPDSTL